VVHTYIRRGVEEEGWKMRGLESDESWMENLLSFSHSHHFSSNFLLIMVGYLPLLISHFLHFSFCSPMVRSSEGEGVRGG